MDSQFDNIYLIGLSLITYLFTCPTSRISYAIIIGITLIFTLWLGAIVFGLFRPADAYIWEKTSSNNYNQRLQKSDISTILEENLTWGEGIVSETDRTLLIPFVSSFFNSSLETSTKFRTAGMIITIMSLLIGSIFFARAFSSQKAIELLLIYSSTPSFAFYFDYGVSVGVCAALSFLSIGLTANILKTQSVFLYIFFGVFLSVCTYEYAPIRILAIGLYIFVALHLLKGSTNKYQLLLAMSFPILLIVYWNYTQGHIAMIYNHRGENVISMLSEPGWLRTLNNNAGNPPEDNLNKFTAAQAMLKNTLSELLYIITPRFAETIGDPPKFSLLYGFSGIFIISGISSLFYKFTGIKEKLGILSVVLCSGILLLLLATSRIDSHRVAVLVPWISYLQLLGFEFLFRSEILTLSVTYLFVLIQCILFNIYIIF